MLTNVNEIAFPPRHRRVVERFVAACQADPRVAAAFLSGSYARGANDAYSDLDLNAIIHDHAYDEFFDQRTAFIRQLGEPIFMQDYHGQESDVVFFMFADEAECELVLGRASRFQRMSKGPYVTLVDPHQILAGVEFTGYAPEPDEQIATVRAHISWFWHDLAHHFITPLARGQIWSAYGSLEDLRRTCVNLARLRQDFAAEAEGYEKLEEAVDMAQLELLRATYCPMERAAMLQAAGVVVRFYQQLAPTLAQEHGILYPADLDRMISARLERLRQG